MPEKLGKLDAWTVLSRCRCRCTMASFWNTFQRRIDEGTARSSLSKWRTFSADWRADKSFGYRCPWKGICLFTKEKRIYFGVAWPMFLRRMCRSHFITQPEQHRSTKRKFFVFYEKFWTAAAIWVIPKRTAQKKISIAYSNLRNALLSGPTGWKHQKSVRRQRLCRSQSS